MIDFWIPKKVPLIKSKEIHGRVRIELHNTRSGSNERIEAHNVVTDAVDEFMWLNYLTYLHGGNGNRPLSIYGDLMGGVMLFEDSINVNNKLLPLGANKLIGYGGNSPTPAGNRGFYNSVESSINDAAGIARQVWDWGTQQGNGTIAAVARTRVNIGNGNFSTRYTENVFQTYHPQGPSAGWSADDSENYMSLIGIDKADNKIYLIRTARNEILVGDFNPILKINDGAINTQRYPRTFDQLTAVCASGSNNGVDWWYNPVNKTIYRINVTTSGPSNDGEIDMYTIDTDSPTPSVVTNHYILTGTRISPGWEVHCCSGGYIYIWGYNPNDVSERGVYRIEIADLTNITFINISSAFLAAGYIVNNINSGGLCPWGVAGCGGIVSAAVGGSTIYIEFVLDKDGNILIGGSNGEPGLSTSNSLSRSTSLACGDGVDTWLIQRLNNTANMSSSNNYTSQICSAYLATVCNLGAGNEVTKTNTETMKLIYTLSDS